MKTEKHIQGKLGLGLGLPKQVVTRGIGLSNKRILKCKKNVNVKKKKT